MAPGLAAFWLILSGHVEPLLLALGLGSVVLVCWLSWRAGVAGAVRVPVRLLLRLPGYFLWLGGQVLVSAVAVVRRVWAPRSRLAPVVTAVPVGPLPELSQVVYANSITLTPGTLTLELADDHVEVHSLDPAGIAQLEAGAMSGRVQRLAGQG